MLQRERANDQADVVLHDHENEALTTALSSDVRNGRVFGVGGCDRDPESRDFVAKIRRKQHHKRQIYRVADHRIYRMGGLPLLPSGVLCHCARDLSYPEMDDCCAQLGRCDQLGVQCDQGGSSSSPMSWDVH